MHLPRVIYGREPAAWAALVEGVLPLLVIVHIAHLTTENVGLIAAAVAAVTAAYTAFATQHQTLAVIVGVIKAGVALSAGFGAGLSSEQAAVIIGVAGVVFSFFQRTQTSPKVAKTRGGSPGHSHAGSNGHGPTVSIDELENAHPPVTEAQHTLTAAGHPVHGVKGEKVTSLGAH